MRKRVQPNIITIEQCWSNYRDLNMLLFGISLGSKSQLGHAF